MKSVLLTVMGFCIFTGVRAQADLNRDSLVRQLISAKEDTSKVILLINTGNAYEAGDPQVAAHYYNLAGSLSRRLKFKRGIIKYISNYSALLNQKGSFDSSLLLNKEGILLSAVMDDEIQLGKCWANTGNVFQYMNQSDSALFCYDSARRIFERSGDKFLVARMGDLLQRTYQDLGDYPKALAYSKEAVSVLRTVNDKISLSIALINMGNNYQELNLPDSALLQYNEALTLGRSIGFKNAEQAALIDIGNLYLHKYAADSMKPYYDQAHAIAMELGDAEGMEITDRGIAHYYLYKNNLAAAKEYIQRALHITDSLDMRKEKAENLKTFSSILYALHDMKEAERYLDSAAIIEKALSGDEMQRKVFTIEAKFQTEKKEAQISLQQSQLRQKSILNYSLIAIAAALISISLLSLRNYRNRQKLQQAKIDELETEKQLNATEAVLKGEEQERTRLAKDLHDGLGGMLSGIKHSLSDMKENLIMTPDNAQAFERSIDMLNSSIKEMRRVAHNMMPEMLLKYGLDIALKEFCADIERSGVINTTYQSMGIDEVTIDQTTAVTVYRVVQELVNNAIKHARAENVLIQLQVAEQGKLLAVTVEDNGIGFDVIQLENSAGIGWNNVKSRVEFLNGKIDINSTEDKGTSILIEINI
jgi:two-component system, NarL family, sensor kinase